MISLMIVDDEVNIREGLRDCVDWRSHGIEISCEAGDGRSAIAEFERVRPDLVLTDVVMPDLDGINFAQAIRNQGRDTGIIFLSAHQDLEFLKSALRFDAVDYLLKPVNIDELLSVVRRAVDRIEARSAAEREITELRDRARESKSAEIDRFYRRIIDGYLSDDGDFQSAASRIGALDREGQPNSVAIVRVACSDAGTELPSRSTVERWIEETWRPSHPPTIIEDHDGRFVLVAEQPAADMAARATETMRAIAEAGFGVTCGIGETAGGLAEIRRSYQSAEIALSRSFFSTTTEPVLYEVRPKRRIPFGVTPRIEDAVRVLAERGSPADAVTELFTAAADEGWSREAILSASVDILMRGYEILARVVEPDMLASLAPPYGELFEAKRLADLDATVIGVLNGWVQAMHVPPRSRESSNRRPHDRRSVVQDARLYIEAHYFESFSVPDVAEAVMMSPSHLSTLFRDETGMSVLEYVTSVRLRKAEELLSETRYKVADAAHAVGYHDANYFSRCFRKHYGMSPAEFRERR